MMGFIRRRNICFQVSQQYLYFMHEINGGDGPGPEVSLVLLHIFSPISSPGHLGLLAHIRPLGDWTGAREGVGRDYDKTLQPCNFVSVETQVVPITEMV